MLLKPSHMFSRSAPAPFDLSWFGSANPCPSLSPVRQVALDWVSCVVNRLHGACTNSILAEITWFSFFSVRLCNNKNLSKYNGNITEPFPGNTAPNNYHSSPEFSHEFQRPDSVSFGSTAVKSKSVTLFTQATQFIVIYLYFSSFFCFFCYTIWLCFVFLLFFSDVSSYKPV